MNTVKFVVISGPSNITKLMQAADMFSKFKVVGYIKDFTLEMDGTVTKETIKNLIPILKSALEEDNEIVTLIHFISMENEELVLKNKDIEPYINKEVREISDGEKWMTLHDVLDRYGIKHEVDENMFIK